MNRILLTVSGPDHPGITFKLMDILHRSKVSIIDIGQNVTYHFLSLSILVDSGNISKTVLEEFEQETKRQGLSLKKQHIISRERKNLSHEGLILSCVSQETLKAKFIGALSKVLFENSINIRRIDNAASNSKQLRVLEILSDAPADFDRHKVRCQLFEVSNTYKVDIALLKDNIFRRSKRLIVFDIDSTLIKTEIIDEMGKLHGIGSEIESITNKAMTGQIDFETALVERVKQLKGFTKSKMQLILDNLSYTEGVQKFIHTVKSFGYKVALISGGFSFFAYSLKKRLDIDYAFANELEIVNGKLTGNIKGEIINAQKKALLLKSMAQKEKISLEQVVAIGDGANDLPMLATAGLGIAYHAKDIVRKAAQNHLSYGPMTSILYFLGLTREINSPPPSQDFPMGI